MTNSEFNNAVQADIRRIVDANTVSACLCGSDDAPLIERVFHWSDRHCILCESCGRAVAAPTRAEAIRNWNLTQQREVA